MTKSRKIYKPHIKKICEQCGKEFEVLYCRRNRKFCCYDCSAKYSKGKPHNWTPRTVFKKGHRHSPETRLKMSINGKGKSSGLRGSKNPNWKGRKYKRYIHTTWTRKYKKWRTAVFKRDEYTCQECDKVGGELQAHHIKGWAEFKDKRFLVGNGVTLCKECHKYVHWVTRLNDKIYKKNTTKT